MRRTHALAVAALLLAAAVAPAAAASPPSRPRGELGVFVLVVDGLNPSEVGSLTPNLSAFRDAAVWYEESRAVMAAETLPNHVAMMTGVYARRNGIPQNDYWPREGEVEDVRLSDPAELDATTLFTRLRRSCPNLFTSAVLSKQYLFDIFQAGGRNLAPHDIWDPRPTMLPEPDEHSLDAITMDAALERLPRSDFMFVSLGDVDRGGHADQTGVLPAGALRTAAVVNADRQVGQFLDALRETGRWERSVVFILSDHGMDWSLPHRFVNLQPSLPEGMFAVENNGTDHVFLLDRHAPDAHRKLKRAREVALAHPGVDRAWYLHWNPADPGHGKVVPTRLQLHHRNAGDLLVTVKRGWRVSESSPNSPNPFSGTHGHLPTMHNVFMVGGGAPLLARPRSVAPSRPAPGPLRFLPEQSENLDVAPTVAWLLGLSRKPYQGRVLHEAFRVRRAPTRCGLL